MKIVSNIRKENLQKELNRIENKGFELISQREQNGMVIVTYENEPKWKENEVNAVEPSRVKRFKNNWQPGMRAW